MCKNIDSRGKNIHYKDRHHDMIKYNMLVQKCISMFKKKCIN